MLSRWHYYPIEFHAKPQRVEVTMVADEFDNASTRGQCHTYVHNFNCYLPM